MVMCGVCHCVWGSGQIWTRSVAMVMCGVCHCVWGSRQVSCHGDVWGMYNSYVDAECSIIHNISFFQC